MIANRSSSVERFVGAVNGRLDHSPLAVMLDIDGTLAPIAPTPADAVVPPATLDVVRRLTHLEDVRIALVSGRSVADVERMTGVPDAWIIGNHGLELCEPGGVPSPAPEASRYGEVVARAAILLEAIARHVPGAIVENKRWTLCVHYRLVDPVRTAPLIAGAYEIARDLGLQATDGKKVVDIRPAIDTNKGTAVTAFAAGAGALHRGSMLYAGDDQTDEDAFRALKTRGERAVTVRVLDSADDQPDGSTEAEHTLASPEDLRRVLEWLVARRAT